MITECAIDVQEPVKEEAKEAAKEQAEAGEETVKFSDSGEVCETKTGDENEKSEESKKPGKPDYNKEEYNYLRNPGFSSEIFKIESKFLVIIVSRLSLNIDISPS